MGDTLIFRSFSPKALRALLLCLMLASVMFLADPLTRPVHATSATLTEWTIPTAGSTPLSLALDPSGTCCWFVESAGNKVAHLDPSTNTFREWTIPTGGATPYGLAVTSVAGSTVIVGTEYGANKVFVFFPSNGTFKEYTLQTPNSGPLYVSIEPGGTYVRAWFTEWFTNAMGELIYDPSTGGATF